MSKYQQITSYKIVSREVSLSTCHQVLVLTWSIKGVYSRQEHRSTDKRFLISLYIIKLTVGKIKALEFMSILCRQKEK